MLGFLRRNSVRIVYGVIIAFIVTTFMGVVFFNESFQSSADSAALVAERQSAVAMIGELPVSNKTYMLQYRRLLSSVPKEAAMNNSLLESLQLNSLQKSIENTLLIHYGRQQKVKAKRAEINASLYSVMDQFEVASKKDLKVAIANNGGSYDDMLSQLKNDIIANKVRQGILSSVSVRPMDIEQSKFQYKIKDFFISNMTTDNVRIDDDELYQTVSEIRDGITNSDDFDAAFKDYTGSSVSQTFKWVPLYQLPPDLGRAIYSLSVNEISRPIRVASGYFMIELGDKKELPVTQHVTEADLLEQWQQQVFYQHLFEFQEGREIRIVDLSLKALKFKSEGRFDEAIEAYTGLISQNPSNPYPNLLLAQIYLMKRDLAKAKQELLKGEIKESLISASVSLPEIHVLLAEIYNEEGFSTKRDQQFDKLMASEDISLNLLNYLKKRFEDLNDNTRLSSVLQKIEDATSTKNIVNDASVLSQQETDNNFLNNLDTSQAD